VVLRKGVVGVDYWADTCVAAVVKEAVVDAHRGRSRTCSSGIGYDLKVWKYSVS